MKALSRGRRSAWRLAARGMVLAWAIAGGPAPDEARAHDALETRCETRLQPRAIFGRNYVLDRVRSCRRVTRTDAPAPAPPDRPVPASTFGAPIEAARQRAEWDRDRATLGNAQYERSVREGRRGIRRRDR
ncbi:MAG: hypothetical protein AAGC67_12935 [Myxococcota bacterium]